MFTPKLNTSRSKYSPFTSSGTGSGNKGRRSLSLHTSQTRSPYGGARGVSANRSLQVSQIVEETPQHRLEQYGGPLPVLVTEALIMADKSTAISVKLDPSGWAWLVCGRRLFVWRYVQSQFGKCHELTLPPSDLSHCAELVALLIHPSDPLTAACVASSPEGIVRYWLSVTHEGSFIETSADLKGEEAAFLISLQSMECVLATTTSTLMLLSPVMGQNQISSRVLRTSSGMFAGISRRMSSFIFGATTTQAPGAVLHQVLAGETMEDDICTFYVLSGSSLQKLSITNTTERVLYQCDLDLFLRPSIAETVWNQDVNNLPNLRTWLIDMQMTRDGVVVLAAAMNPDVSAKVYYILGTLHTAGSDPPQSFLSFTVSKFTGVYQEEEEATVLGYRLLLPDPTNSNIYVYSSSMVVCLSVSSSSQPLDKVEFQAQGNKILGAGHSEGCALFFSNLHGILSVTECQESMLEPDITMAEASIMSDSFMKRDATLGHVTLDKVEELTMSEDKTSRLKAAFLHACRGNLTQAQVITEELFPSDIPPSIEPGSALDSLVSLLSQEMTDDFPTSDPRWAESVPHDGTSSSTSLILQHQLEDKLKAHEFYMTFLKNVNIWLRLRTVRVRESCMPTRLVLCEHAEKLTAAMTLRVLHLQHPQLVDAAIKQVLMNRRETLPASGLTAQDVFYRQVSRVEDLLEVLFANQEKSLGGGLTPQEVVTLISTVNIIFISMLRDATMYRQSKASLYQPTPAGDYEPQYIPWTTTTGLRGTRVLLTKQHHNTVEKALNSAHDTGERGVLLQQLLDLTDLILDGYQTELDWIRRSVGETSHYTKLLVQYEQERTDLIAPFMAMEQYERAASLAEKYCDFTILVQLCEETENQERLQRYMNQFQTRGFSDFVFKWYMEAGKRGKLMSMSMANHPQLGRFLHQNDNLYMSWVHDVNVGNFGKAHQTLMELAYKEKESVAKKKTLMSLSKLAVLAADEPPADLTNRLEAINDEHDLILHQETLPEDVVESLGLELDNMKVFAPEELIELYISDMNVNANEYDFKKALDLLQYVNQSDPNIEYAKILMHIWCRAILKDRWEDLSTDDPLEHSKDTVFFKTVELAYTEGLDLREYLPVADQLLATDELGDLRQSANFQYLVKAGYEQVSRILA